MSGRGRGARSSGAARRATRSATAAAEAEGVEPATEEVEARGIALLGRLRAAGVSEEDLREVEEFGELLVEARYSAPLACAHGLWQRLATMNDHYVLLSFPFSRWLARVLDFLG